MGPAARRYVGITTIILDGVCVCVGGKSLAEALLGQCQRMSLAAEVGSYAGTGSGGVRSTKQPGERESCHQDGKPLLRGR